MRSNRKSIGISFCRGVVATSVLIAGLTVRGDDKDNKYADSKDAKTGSSHFSAQDETTEGRLKNAAKMNLATIQYGQLAARKAQSPELKQFGQKLEQDHQKSQTELKRLAQKHNVTLPTEVDEKCQQMVAELQAKNGQEFDRAFAKGSVEGHAMAIAHLQHAAKKAQEPEIRQYLQTMLSQVKEHQQKGRQIAKTVGVDEATITSLENKVQEAVGSGAQSETSSETSSQTTSPKARSSESTQPSNEQEKK